MLNITSSNTPVAMTPVPIDDFQSKQTEINPWRKLRTGPRYTFRLLINKTTSMGRLMVPNVLSLLKLY